MITLLFSSLALVLAGLILMWVASTKRTQLHPYHSNCDSEHIFKRKSWYTPAGYNIHLAGYLMIFAGFLCNAAYYFLK